MPPFDSDVDLTECNYQPAGNLEYNIHTTDVFDWPQTARWNLGLYNSSQDVNLNINVFREFPENPEEVYEETGNDLLTITDLVIDTIAIDDNLDSMYKHSDHLDSVTIESDNLLIPPPSTINDNNNNNNDNNGNYNSSILDLNPNPPPNNFVEKPAPTTNEDSVTNSQRWVVNEPEIDLSLSATSSADIQSSTNFSQAKFNKTLTTLRPASRPPKVKVPADGLKMTVYGQTESFYSVSNPKLFVHYMNLYFYPYVSPNNLTINDFEDDELYSYEENKAVTSFIPNRTEMKNEQEGVNFYEPLVYRALHSKKSINSKKYERAGLCPYCPATTNTDRLFFDMNTSTYLHHVTKHHGVYSNGTEMPFPFGLGKSEEVKPRKNGGVGRKLVDCIQCAVCFQSIKILPLDNGKGGNKFLAYYRHMLNHNQKKNSGKGRN